MVTDVLEHMRVHGLTVPKAVANVYGIEEAVGLELLEALVAMERSHGMHGPCSNNSCSECDRAYKKALASIAKARGES